MNEFDERLRKIDARARLRASRLAKGEDDDETPKLPGEDSDPVGGATQALAGVLPALLALEEGEKPCGQPDDDEGNQENPSTAKSVASPWDHLIDARYVQNLWAKGVSSSLNTAGTDGIADQFGETDRARQFPSPWAPPDRSEEGWLGDRHRGSDEQALAESNQKRIADAVAVYGHGGGPPYMKEHRHPDQWDDEPTEALHGELKGYLRARRTATAGAFARPDIDGSTVAVAPDATIAGDKSGLGRASWVNCRACGKVFRSQAEYSEHLVNHTTTDMRKSFDNLQALLSETAALRAQVTEARELVKGNAKQEAIVLRKSLHLAEGQRVSVRLPNGTNAILRVRQDQSAPIPDALVSAASRWGVTRTREAY